MNTQSRAAIVRALLQKEPWVEVPHTPIAVGAHACRSVFHVWRELEGLTKRCEEPPYWAAVWPGATLLATVLLNNPTWVRGKRVVDVGCGAGIGGIAAAKAGAANVTANDVDLYALEAARFNAALNGVTVQTVALDLTNSAPEEWQASNTLLLSEMFYNAVAADRMWAWLQRLRARGVSAILADAERPFFRTTGLEKVAQATLPVDYELEGVRERCVTVYAMNA